MTNDPDHLSATSQNGELEGLATSSASVENSSPVRYTLNSLGSSVMCNVDSENSIP